MKYIDKFLFSSHMFFKVHRGESDFLAKFSTVTVLTILFCMMFLGTLKVFNIFPLNGFLESRKSTYLFSIVYMSISSIPFFLLVWKREKYYMDGRFTFGRNNLFYLFGIIVFIFILFSLIVAYSRQEFIFS